MRRLAMGLAVVGLVLAGCGASDSPDVTKIRDPGSVASGSVLYQVNCSRCHGPDAEGGRVPGGPLAPSLVSRTSLSDALLSEIITRGQGLAMPSFGTQLEETEINSIIDFVRSLQVATSEGG